MAQTLAQKAPFNDWWYWSECLIKRLNTLADLYRENDEAERGEQALDWSKKLKNTCMVPVAAARKGMKTDEEKAKVKQLEETAIFDIAMMFHDLLANLPFMSTAIQGFLGVVWDDCKWEEPEAEEIDEDTGLPVRKKKKKGTTDTRIIELFWGPKARQDEGIRTGRPDDGGLPGIISNMLMAEKTTSTRSPTDYGSAMLSSVQQTGVAQTLNNAPKPGGFP